MGRSVAAVWRLSPDEKIFGCGESFTRLDKRGQKINLFMRDAMGAQTPVMYKPIPFFLSSEGYGVFLHTSAPITLDVGRSYDQSNAIYMEDDAIDMFDEPHADISQIPAFLVCGVARRDVTVALARRSRRPFA